MRKMKRVLSLLLVVLMLVNLIPSDVFATPNSESEATANSDMTIEGTNSLGNLLSKNLTEYQEETACVGGYTVTNLVVEGNTAAITYDAKEEALLIAALYTEDGLQLLQSAQTIVKPEEKTAELSFEGEMPEYFRAAAYLVDTYTFSPLCENYETPMYTKAMQELLDSTVNDYDADRVWNLGDDLNTNFMVYEESTIVIPAAEGVNEVVSIDDENAAYVIENADEKISGLQKGDIFVYHFSEDEALIVKVDKIKEKDSTVTITGADLEMEEVFSQVKLEADGTTYDFTIDESIGDGSVTYVGKAEDTPQTYWFGDDDVLDGTAAKKDWIEFEIEKNVYENDEGDSFKIYGKMKNYYEMRFSYYIAEKIEYLSFEFEMQLETHIGVEGEIKLAELPVVYIGIAPVPGLSVGVELGIVFKTTGSVENYSFGAISIGISYEEGYGYQNISKEPMLESKFEVEGTLYFGFEITPKVRVLSGCLVELGIPAESGFELNAKYSEVEGATEHSNYADEKHICKKCLDGGVVAKVSIGAELQFLKCDWLTIRKEWEHEVPLFEFYYSFDYKDGGFGGCPYYSYKQTIRLRDIEGNILEGIPVDVEWRTQEGTTNRYGVVILYLPKGEYKLLAEVDGEIYNKGIKVVGAQKVEFRIWPKIEDEENGGDDSTSGPDMENSIGGGVFEDTKPEDITQINGKVVDSGECGTEGNNVIWTVYDNGLLVISGSGAMRTVSGLESSYNEYKNEIVKVMITSGITQVSNSAFLNFQNLISVELPDTLESVGNSSFSGCQNVTNIELPAKLNHIGDWSFNECSSLETINFPEGLRTIGNYAFLKCGNLKSIKLPTTLNTLGSHAFSECSSLSGSVVIPSGITDVGAYTFESCKSLEEIVFSDALKSIGQYAMYNCDSLKTIEIPEGVETIGEGVFSRCDNLVSAKLPKSLTTLSNFMFNSCKSLSEVEIPEGVTNIGTSVFADCDSLTSIEFPSTVESLGSLVLSTSLLYRLPKTVWFRGSAPSVGGLVFDDVNVTIYYPANDRTWTEEVQEDFQSQCPFATLTWISCAPSNAAEVKTDESIPTKASFGGEYGNETIDGREVKTASFKELVPGGQYLLLAVKDTDAENFVSDENVLYVKQGMASEDGMLHFQYIPKMPTDITYVVVCGPSNKNLNDAQITFPEMYVDEEIQVVEPIVVYDGKTLVEEKDYIVIGEVSYTEAGKYTCYVKGIHNYTGVVECKYIVKDNSVSDAKKIERIYGETRYETSFEIADAYKENLGVSKFDTVIIACGTNFADALAGSYLASVHDAPILMYNNKVGKSNVADLIAYVNENLVSNGKVYLLGGIEAVGEDVEKAFSEYQVKRLGGADRYDTNLEILKEAGVEGKDLLVCTGQGFADSLSGSAVQMPILLVNNKKGNLTDTQKTFLEEFDGKTLYVIGGTEAVCESLELQLNRYGNAERIGGNTRYETSVLLAEKFFDKPKAAVLTLGKNFPDGLCGGMLAISMDAPLVLTISNKNFSAADAYAEKWGIESGAVLGGPGLITDETVRSIFNMQADEIIIVK